MNKDDIFFASFKIKIHLDVIWNNLTPINYDGILFHLCVVTHKEFWFMMSGYSRFISFTRGLVFPSNLVGLKRMRDFICSSAREASVCLQKSKISSVRLGPSWLLAVYEFWCTNKWCKMSRLMLFSSILSSSC